MNWPQNSNSPAGASVVTPITSTLFMIVGGSAAVLIANLYYAQPLITIVGSELGLAPEFAGSVVSASQLGYGVGLLLLVPLSDMIENRRLVLTCGLITLLGIVGIATARSAGAFLGFALLTGIFSSGAQMLIPYLSHLVPQASRGRILGNVMAGVLTSVMLARPFASFVAAAFGWRAVYWASAVTTLVLGVALWRIMPQRHPLPGASYGNTLKSMFTLYSGASRVRRRTLYQALLFASFTMFWAVTPIMLTQRFGLTQAEIGLFALVGAGGALAAPIAGRLADRGSTRSGTALAALLIALSFLLSLWSVKAGALIGLGAAALMIDAFLQTAQTFSRLIVLEVAPAIRGRVNALYMTIVYFSGALGSVIGVLLYAHVGWTIVAAVGAAAALIVFAAVLLEPTA